MIGKATLLAMVVFLGSVNLAEAQTYFNGGVPGPNTVLGWNFGHIAYCSTVSDASNTWIFLWVQEGGYGYTNNPSLAAIVAPGCQTGNLFAVHVLSLNPFLWDVLVLYPFK
jgi:hypothetical protein